MDDGPGRTGRVVLFTQSWLASVHFAYRCSPRLAAVPPAFDQCRAELSDVYLIVTGDLASRRRERLLEAEPARGVRPVAGDSDEISRWQDESIAYVSVLDEVGHEQRAYWRDHAPALPLTQRKSRSFDRWRAVLDAGYERLWEASDRYRPVVDEVTEAIEQTVRARAELSERWQRLFGWERRPGVARGARG